MFILTMRVNQKKHICHPPCRHKFVSKKTMTNMGIAENKDLVAQHVCRAFTTKYSGACNGKQVAIVKVLGPLTPQLDGLTITPDNTIAEGDYLVVQARSHGRVNSGGT
jgi:hypothetical protein